MKKGWIAAGVAGVLVLGGSGLAYQAYADQPAETSAEASETKVIDTNTVIKEEPEIEAEQEAPTYDVPQESAPREKSLLPDSLIDSDGLTMTHKGIGTNDFGSGLRQSATYFTQSGRQYAAIQYSGTPEENAKFFRQIPSLYKEPTLNVTIGGQEAIAVDGEFRRVVHFRIGNEALLISSWDDSVEELVAVAEQIAAQP
ncbi:hypothetical protein CDO73_12890 [Saccharibacillus sp. O23]|uniref:hypothetical protein n=1 Tax=Saccharibacillus sp. O23 TaxID=2009338 RepID=UPI000B4E6862|nr:hypothetical protein [Saccharibacillus sp. O23]OWR29968.1 hypothetical protein CDO73_12890 [Saccharibacillus sp. O23]